MNSPRVVSDPGRTFNPSLVVGIGVNWCVIGQNFSGRNAVTLNGYSVWETAVARYYFDIYNGISLMRDMVGNECADFQAMREEAMDTLPVIARDAIPKDGDRQAFTINVRNEANRTVYTATLTFAGLRMDDDIPPMDNPND